MRIRARGLGNNVCRTRNESFANAAGVLQRPKFMRR